MNTRHIHKPKTQKPYHSGNLNPSLFLWSLCMHLFHVFGVSLAILFSRLQPLFWNRGLRHAQNLKHLNSSNLKDRYLFFCSSAGEYEQGLPLARRLEQAGGEVVICFFSKSGYTFAQARGEKRYYFLSPIDSYWAWKKVFETLKPQASFVVRHEFWPGFLKFASVWRKGLFLINASKSLSASNQIQYRLKSKMLSYFRKIYYVSKDDHDYFTKRLGIPGKKILCTGDSKYDSVYERSLLKKTQAIKYRDLLDQFGLVDSRLILGSAWDMDVKVGLGALAQLKQQVSKKLQVMVALHKPEDQAISAVEHACKQLKLSHMRLSTMMKLEDGTAQSPKAAYDVIIVDSVGILSELYCCGQLAFVGGGLHYQVHNVLEPAFYALALAYGPLYKNSGEAIVLAESQAASIINEKDDLIEWWTYQMNSRYASGQQASSLIKSYLGATDDIVADLKAEHIIYDGKTTRNKRKPS